MTATVHTVSVSSPVGPLHLAEHRERLCMLAFDPHADQTWDQIARWLGPTREDRPTPFLTDVSERLGAYFDGDLTAIDAVPVEPPGTEFQRAVWRALRDIPAGATTSYGELARALQNPRACRAVGAANGRNPVAIVIPCHRVIGSDHTLIGYGGGLDRKRWLLRHEGLAIQEELPLDPD